MSVRILSFTKKHLEDAAKLFTRRYKEMRSKLVILPSQYENQDLILPLLQVLVDDEPIVIFTADPRLCPQDCWLRDYFPFLYEAVYKVNPPIKDLKMRFEKISSTRIEVITFLVPHDIRDGFSFSGWRKPEKYLDPLFRAGTSAFTSVPQGLVTSAIQRLRTDLESGTWREEYRDILERSHYGGGYRLLVTRKR